MMIKMIAAISLLTFCVAGTSSAPKFKKGAYVHVVTGPKSSDPGVPTMHEGIPASTKFVLGDIVENGKEGIWYRITRMKFHFEGDIPETKLAPEMEYELGDWVSIENDEDWPLAPVTQISKVVYQGMWKYAIRSVLILNSNRRHKYIPNKELKSVKKIRSPKFLSGSQVCYANQIWTCHRIMWHLPSGEMMYEIRKGNEQLNKVEESDLSVPMPKRSSRSRLSIEQPKVNTGNTKTSEPSSTRQPQGTSFSTVTSVFSGTRQRSVRPRKSLTQRMSQPQVQKFKIGDRVESIKEGWLTNHQGEVQGCKKGVYAVKYKFKGRDLTFEVDGKHLKSVGS